MKLITTMHLHDGRVFTPKWATWVWPDARSPLAEVFFKKKSILLCGWHGTSPLCREWAWTGEVLPRWSWAPFTVLFLKPVSFKEADLVFGVVHGKRHRADVGLLIRPQQRDWSFLQEIWGYRPRIPNWMDNFPCLHWNSGSERCGHKVVYACRDDKSPNLVLDTPDEEGCQAEGVLQDLVCLLGSKNSWQVLTGPAGRSLVSFWVKTSGVGGVKRGHREAFGCLQDLSAKSSCPSCGKPCVQWGWGAVDSTGGEPEQPRKIMSLSRTRNTSVVP